MRTHTPLHGARCVGIKGKLQTKYISLLSLSLFRLTYAVGNVLVLSNCTGIERVLRRKCTYTIVRSL